MNGSASNLADRKKLQGAIQNERFLKAKERRNQEFTLSQRAGCLLQGYLPLGDGRGLSGRLLH